ncbi:MAG: NAD(P)H-binding protein [Chloroflexi bacterium]|nr:NAD(P)H-binding protein [Chloroflexota bacterium]MBP8058385.1 NAD(P)H-binding protein [Chloroflexota bacterium]
MILVTGSTGFVGRSVVRWLELEQRPHIVFRGRINDPVALREPLQGVDTIIHLASAERRGSNRALHYVDSEGTSQLLRAAQSAGVRRIIYLSRLGADPNAAPPLLRVKGEVERLLRRSNLAYTILRASSLYGREDRFLNMLVRITRWTWPLVILPGGGEIAMQPLWVEDVARCLVACLDRPDLQGQTLMLAGAERFRFKEMMELVVDAAAMRRYPFYLRMPFTRVFAILLYGWRFHPPISRYFLDRLSIPEVADLDTVRRIFGFQPARLRETIAYLRR